jgi:hypothetical protein
MEDTQRNWVVEERILSEPELADFIQTCEKLVRAELMEDSFFKGLLKGLSVERTHDGGYMIDEGSTYYFKKVADGDT